MYRARHAQQRIPRNHDQRREFTAARLNDLIRKDQNKVTFSLSSNLTSLKELFNLPITYEVAELFLRVLKKSLQSVSLKEQNNQILSSVFHSNFPSRISQILMNINELNARNVFDFLCNLMFLLKMIFIRNPTDYLPTIPVIGHLSVVLGELDVTMMPDETQELRNKLEELQHLLKVSEEKTEVRSSDLDLEDSPPEDFRTLEIVPSAESLLSEDNVFIRKNKLKGAYDNVDHYLDVQYRLLREDFLSPLRNGIRDYLALAKDQKTRINDLRIYHNVHVLYPLCTLDGIAYRVSFNVSHNVNWEQSKRLLYGSLVALTSDNFQTIYFATVAAREVPQLKEGYIDLIFISLENIPNFSLDTSFILAETTAYFEACHPILTALKEINEENMPFQDYIIHGKSDVKTPKYLTQQNPLKMDLACLTNDCKLVYHSRERVVEVDSENSLSLDILHDPWPKADDLKLNDSQYQALQNVLTKEFSLTQGPPGTGKTYIGLKIVKALCANTDLWRSDRKSPLLIVSYTNQALDKFLEEIAAFLKGGILRIGGRSKSEVLEKYILKNVRQIYIKNKSFSRDVVENRNRLNAERYSLKTDIENITSMMKMTTKGILHEDILETHMGQFYNWLQKSYEDNFQRRIKKNDSILTQWLGYGDIEIVQVDEREEQNVDEGADNAVADANNVYTEVDFINDNRMLDNDNDIEDFSKLEIIDKEFIALAPDDLKTNEFTPDGFQRTKKDKKRMKNRLRKDLNSNASLTDDEVDQIRDHDLWLMSKSDRWRLYRYWVNLYCQHLKDQIVQKQLDYDSVCKASKEIRHSEDGEIMKDSLIVGMTTTAAAKYHLLLLELKPKIIIVEEAAEILEAHVVTALNPLCEHLILIGDHKQLRPNPNVFELARNYNLEISLFERMVLNKCHVKCLSSQHRMRPEISQLLHPIYPDLCDDQSVTKYENIQGLPSNLFFIQHNELEKTNPEGTSYSNPYEADFCIGLCEYLLKQGYKPSQITVLTMYTSQLFNLKKLMRGDFYKGVHLTVVDNYQGEENDIILLSLVRNNVEKKVGFLKIDNRVCVALSRAKMGFYVIGNFEILAEQSKLWRNILQTLKSVNQVGCGLTLCCLNHPDRKIEVKDPSDFSQAPEGGCLMPCESRLNCGHMCKRYCHPIDDHDEYKCLEQCTKLAPNCPENHRCIDVCSQKCSPCKKMVTKVVPQCNHQQKMTCSTNPNTFTCREACQELLLCGHQCKKCCGESCTDECMFSVHKTYPCGHSVESPCFQQVSLCPEPCSKRLDCGHLCSGKCGECSDRRIHSLCSHGCQQDLICGHKCQNQQCNVCSPCLRPCKNRCIHSKCMKSCGELCIPCKEPCEWFCEHYKCTRYCHESCDRPKCNEPCLKLLRCGHNCVGLCGEKCPRLCRVCNGKDLTEIFFGTEDEEDARFIELEDCGHIFESSGLDEWMSRDIEGEIQLKVCPKCKTPIRRNLRYGEIINKVLMDIDQIKKKMIGEKPEIDALIIQIKVDIRKVNLEYQTVLKNQLMQSKQNILKVTLFYWRSFQHRIAFLSILSELMEEPVLEEEFTILQHCEDLCNWIVNNVEIFSETQFEETKMEIERIENILQIFTARKTVGSMTPECKQLVDEGLKLLMSPDYAVVRDKVLEILKSLSEFVQISEKEKKEIVQAMGLQRGHWFKCPKGHVYAIGECGGATERSKCPECGLIIGGENHALAEGNSHAGEMDGSSYAAYSEEANMNNYHFDFE